jgi:hypothetical protein
MEKEHTKGTDDMMEMIRPIHELTALYLPFFCSFLIPASGHRVKPERWLWVKFILPLRACALTFSFIGFAEMCICTLLKANSMGERVRACALKGKKNRLWWLCNRTILSSVRAFLQCSGRCTKFN